MHRLDELRAAAPEDVRREVLPLRGREADAKLGERPGLRVQLHVAPVHHNLDLAASDGSETTGRQ